MKAFMRIFVSFLGYHLNIWRTCYASYHALTGKYLLGAFIFHRITDNEKTKHLYLKYEQGLDYAIFEHRLNAIARYFRIVSLDEFKGFVTGEKPLKENAALLTFDDADSDLLQYALPVLSKYGCKAVVFVPTGHVEDGKNLWSLRLSNVISKADSSAWKKIQDQSGELPPHVRSIILSSSNETENEKANVARKLTRAFDKTVPIDVINRTIECWEDAVHAEYSGNIRCLGWEELGKLAEKGIDVGSHAVDHTKLAEISPDEVAKQLYESKKVIQARLGTVVDSIAYPSGSFNEKVVEIAQTIGYKIGFSSRPGTCLYPLKGLDLLKLKRLHLGGEDKYSMHYNLGKIALKAFSAGKL